MLFLLIRMKPHCLQLSVVQKRELFNFINTKNKVEYRRTIVVKQKMEGQSFWTVVKNLTVNCRNVYYMIKSYKEHGLDGMSKRSNAKKTLIKSSSRSTS